MNAPNKTGRKCTVCGHPERNAIEMARSNGESLRGVSRRFAVGEDALGRHMADHVQVAAEVATMVAEVARHDVRVVVMPLEQQRERVLAVTQKMMDRMERLADQLSTLEDHVVVTEKGFAIHPIVPELRSWVAEFSRRHEHLDKMRVATASVKLEERRFDMMERALELALDAAGVIDRGPAYRALSEALDVD